MLTILDLLDFFLDCLSFFWAIENKAAWLVERLTEIFLFIATWFFVHTLRSGIQEALLPTILFGGIGTLFFAIVDVCYVVWWFREGRFDIDPPWLDVLPLPKGDLNNTPPEDSPFGTKSEPSVWDQMGVNK